MSIDRLGFAIPAPGSAGYAGKVNDALQAINDMAPLSLTKFHPNADGSDDTGPFMDALNYAIAHKLPLYIPPPGDGAFYGVGDLTATDYVEVNGLGWNHTMLRALPGTSKMLTLQKLSFAFPMVAGLCFDGAGEADYGVYLEDETVKATLRQLQIVNCNGAPGAAIANGNHNNSLEVDRCLLMDNNLGLKLKGLVQAAMIRACLFSQNSIYSAELGETGAGPIAGICFDDCVIDQGGVVGGTAIANIHLLGGVSPLTFSGTTYMEAPANAASSDFLIEPNGWQEPYTILLDHYFANGNGGADYAIRFPADGTRVRMAIKAGRIGGFTQTPPFLNHVGVQRTLELGAVDLIETGIASQGAKTALRLMSGHMVLDHLLRLVGDGADGQHGIEFEDAAGVRKWILRQIGGTFFADYIDDADVAHTAMKGHRDTGVVEFPVGVQTAVRALTGADGNGVITVTADGKLNWRANGASHSVGP